MEIEISGVPFNPYYQDTHCAIFHADCKKVLPFLPVVDLVLTDPPYGINATKQTLGIGKRKFHRGTWDTHCPRNLNQVLDAGVSACIWGGNYMTEYLSSTNDWLVWHKKNDGRSFSECELAWTNFGCQTRHLSHHWSGESKSHPTQKPLDVVRWCLKWAPEDTKTVIDPFMGVGTMLLAAKIDGMTAVGIEINEKYCEIAANRLSQGVLF